MNGKIDFSDEKKNFILMGQCFKNNWHDIKKIYI